MPQVDMEMESPNSVTVLQRQYLQNVDPKLLTLPEKDVLKKPAVQQEIYACMFDELNLKYPPSERYQYRVLKRIMTELEKAMDDPDEDEIVDDLSAHFAAFMSKSLPSEAATAQQKAFVTYTAPLPSSEAFQIFTLEAPSLLASSGTTGLRTWEAALHLGSFLCSAKGKESVRGRNVIELGAGTGFVSVLCAKYLEASHVLATDGSLSVLNDIKANVALNEMAEQSALEVKQLRWGHSLLGGPVDPNSGGQSFGLAIGADVTYDFRSVPALVATLRDVFELQPSIQVYIAATKRNEDTLDCFLQACARNDFRVQELDVRNPPFVEQHGFFITGTTPIAIYAITGPDEPRDAFRA